MCSVVQANVGVDNSSRSIFAMYNIFILVVSNLKENKSAPFEITLIRKNKLIFDNTLYWGKIVSLENLL